ncbi:MAG: hypothetical protein WCL06_10250 [Bacteroidota bacterium]
MKNLLLLSALMTMSLFGHTQQTKGWEFLQWNTSKDSVEKVLKEKNNLLSEPWALDANFNFQGMNTWLIYNTQNKLIQVHQRKTFSVINQKEAAEFYKTKKTELITKYGKPQTVSENKKDSVVNLLWKLKYTRITLEYDYRYKIIDEFGAGSYWVDIVFEPAKSE